MPALRRMALAAAALLAGLGALRAAAQSVRWDPAGGSLAVGQVTTLQLTFDGCEPKGTPSLPNVDGLTLQYSSQASNISWINGDWSRSTVYTYAALLNKRQAVEIPSFSVETTKGSLTVPAVRFQPTDATVGGTGQSLESAASSVLEGPPRAVWAGQVFGLTYRIDAAQSYYPDFGHGAFSWNADPLVAEDWSQPQPFSRAAGGETRTGFVYHSRAIARKPGHFRLNPVNQLVNLSVGVTGFGFFQQRQYQQFSVSSDTPSLLVNPLPPPPPGFSGAVGDFKLTSKVVPQSISVGEPVTWTLELSGTGNWPDIPGLPPRQVSRDFQVITPKPKRTLAEGKLFDAKLSEDVVLVPTAPGSYPLEPFHFIYFDPGSGTYKTLATPRFFVTVTPAAAAPSSAAATPAPSAPAAPELPSGLPRDPLAGPAAASPLWTGAVMAVACVAPFVLVLGFWLLLSWQRAREADPLRRRREARRRLEQVLADLRSSPSPERRSSLLLAWQRDAAQLWGVAQAAPIAGDLALAEVPPGEEWSRLWLESDRALYGPEGPLPADWLDRAEVATAGASVPRFDAKGIFRPRHLLPFLFAAVLLAGVSPASGAESPASAYRRGDFAAAEKGWREELARDPLDWAARYNLSLALSQEDRWGEAAAEASAAFVQNPTDRAVRWQFELACEKAGFVPVPLSGFLSPETGRELARAASPASWQRIGASAALLAALAAALLLAGAYGRIPRPLAVRTGVVLLAVAVVAALLAEGGWHAWGEAANSRAAIVWQNGTLRSIPTEAEKSQKTVPLPAGSVGLADRTFLGWERLVFANGQTGWVRREEAVPIWR